MAKNMVSGNTIHRMGIDTKVNERMERNVEKEFTSTKILIIIRGLSRMTKNTG